MRKCYVIMGSNDCYQWLVGVYSSKTKALKRKLFLDADAPEDTYTYEIKTEVLQ